MRSIRIVAFSLLLVAGNAWAQAQDEVRMYQGAWKLDPEMAALKVTLYGESFARVVVPIRYTTSAAAAPERFLVQQNYIKTAIGWRITTMVPLAVPAQ